MPGEVLEGMGGRGGRGGAGFLRLCGCMESGGLLYEGSQAGKPFQGGMVQMLGKKGYIKERMYVCRKVP